MYAHLVHVSASVRAAARTSAGVGPGRSSPDSFFALCSAGRGAEHIHVDAHHRSGAAFRSECFITFAHEFCIICINGNEVEHKPSRGMTDNTHEGHRHYTTSGHHQGLAAILAFL